MDSSAYVKLPLREVGHRALRDGLIEWDGYVSSALLGVEAIRACSRYPDERHSHDARAWLFDVVLVPIDDSVLDVAASLQPVGIRSLDAIHLATALSVRDDIGAFFTYDDRLAAAAKNAGFEVIRPS